MTTPLNKTPLIAAAVMLLLASVETWPYGFYQILRIVVCGAGLYAAFKANEMGRQNWTWAMGVVAALFNPVLVVRFSREEWQPIDFVVGIVFLASLKFLRPLAGAGVPDRERKESAV
jgi:phosphatidylserine synthase